MLLGKTDGRRAGEINYIAMGLLTYEMFINEDGMIYQKLSMSSVISKGKGIVKLDLAFWKNKFKLSKNLTVMLLVLCQRREIIKCAIDVYNGKEEFHNNSTNFEKVADFQIKLTQAYQFYQVESNTFLDVSTTSKLYFVSYYI